jgi:ElaB/YqjD/DUF883 family membrane-anchored ribosome-binding protein
MIFSGSPDKTILEIIISGKEQQELNNDEGKNQRDNKEWCVTMSEETINKVASGADQLKNQTIDALEEAARKLRNADVSVSREHVENILHGVQDQVEVYKEEIGAKYHEMEAEYHKQVEPVENIICDHPIPAVMVALGIGFLFGMLVSRRD